MRFKTHNIYLLLNSFHGESCEFLSEITLDTVPTDSVINIKCYAYSSSAFLEK